MSYATEIMEAAIAHSIERCRELNSNRAAGWTESKIGTVYVSVVQADMRNTTNNRVMKKAWKLNGKVISADKLEALLNA